MKGILLAGGSGTRLYPLTTVTSKQLLPVYDKPMIYYPLSVLMLTGIREILIICTPHDLPKFRQLLGDGSQFGIELVYETQPSPDGLAQALIIGEPFLAGEPCALILGDNIFYGGGFTAKLKEAASRESGATIFGYYVPDPERFGVYFYDERAVEFAESVRPSTRGELEITDVNRRYLEDGSLNVTLLHRGSAWLDTGTTESLYRASEYVRVIEQNQGLQVAALEEIAFNKGWIDERMLERAADRYGKSPYGAHLKNVLERKVINSYLSAAR